jgi:YD repeat-containing protein
VTFCATLSTRALRYRHARARRVSVRRLHWNGEGRVSRINSASRRVVHTASTALPPTRLAADGGDPLTSKTEPAK